MSLGSNELVLFTHNTGALYPMRKAITLRMLRKQLRGEYDREAAVKAWMTLANAGAKRYVRELKLSESWNQAFTVADREAAAKHWENWFRESAKYGEFDWMLPEKDRPKRRSSNPGHNPGPKKKKKATKKRATRQPRCPIGTEVQTLIFPKGIYTQSSAKAWAKRHDFKTTKIHETADSYRIRQKEKTKFDPRMFRTISLGQVTAVVGCPKTRSSSSRKKTAKKKTAKKTIKKTTKKTTKKKTAKKKTTKKAGNPHPKRTTKKRTARAAGWSKVRGTDAYVSANNAFVIERTSFGDYRLFETRGGSADPKRWRSLGLYSSMSSAKGAARDFR